MALRINKSYLTATLILIGIGAWMGTGTFKIGGQATASADAQSISERAESALQKVPVRIQTVVAQDRKRDLQIRGRTQADATISVRSETNAIVAKRLVELGDVVQPGDLLCELNPAHDLRAFFRLKPLLSRLRLTIPQIQLCKKGDMLRTIRSPR